MHSEVGSDIQGRILIIMIHRIKEFIIIILAPRRKEYKESYLVGDVDHDNFVELES